MEQLKLLSTVAVLTLLIWASADSLVNETVIVGGSFRVSKEVGKPDLIVDCDESQVFELQLTGPRKITARVQAAAPLLIRLPVASSPTGTYHLPLKEALEEHWHEFPRLSLVSIQPPELPVTIDHLVVKEVEVALKKSLSLAYDVPPRPSRPTVTVTMQESHFKQAFQDAGKPLVVELDPEPYLREQPRGESVAVQLSLLGKDLGFGENSVFHPSTIMVAATVRAERITERIPTVPILIAASFGNFSKGYKVTVPEGGPPLVTRTITVTGPAEEVRTLLEGPPPLGWVRLKQEHFDQTGVQLSFTPEFQLPAGITLAKEPEQVLLTLYPPE